MPSAVNFRPLLREWLIYLSCIEFHTWLWLSFCSLEILMLICICVKKRSASCLWTRLRGFPTLCSSLLTCLSCASREPQRWLVPSTISGTVYLRDRSLLSWNAKCQVQKRAVLLSFRGHGQCEGPALSVAVGSSGGHRREWVPRPWVWASVLTCTLGNYMSSGPMHSLSISVPVQGMLRLLIYRFVKNKCIKETWRAPNRHYKYSVDFNCQ